VDSLLAKDSHHNKKFFIFLISHGTHKSKKLQQSAQNLIKYRQKIKVSGVKCIRKGTDGKCGKKLLVGKPMENRPREAWRKR
jgi:hypothetical protein